MGADSDSSPSGDPPLLMNNFVSSTDLSHSHPPNGFTSELALQSSLSTDLEVPISHELSLPTASDIVGSSPLLYRLSRSITSMLEAVARAPPQDTGKSHVHVVNNSPNVSDFLPSVGLLSPTSARPGHKGGSHSGNMAWWGSKSSKGRSCCKTSVLWLLALLVVSVLLIIRVNSHHRNHHQSMRGKHRDANGWLSLDHFLGQSHDEHNRRWDDEETNTLFDPNMWQRLTGSKASTRANQQQLEVQDAKMGAGEKGEAEKAEGEKAEGEKAEGETAEGEKAEGENTEGENTEGDKAEGDKAEEDKGEGEKGEGEKAEGERAEGDKAEGDKEEGEKGEGEKGGQAGNGKVRSGAKPNKQQQVSKQPKGPKVEVWEDVPVLREAKDMVNQDGEIVSLGTRVEKEEYSLLPNPLELARLQLEMEKGLVQAIRAVKKMKELAVAKTIHGAIGVAEDRGYVAICTIAKDQNGDICEWLRYHHYVLGVQAFYIYDHESKVPLMANITGCISLQHVVYSYINTPNIRGGPLDTPQMYAYNQCIMRSKGMHQWMAFIDMDEFITLTKPVKLAEFLKPYEPYGALGLNWRIFGSSGHLKRPKGDVMASYADCLPNSNQQNIHTKAIVNMHHVVGMNQPHYPNLKPGRYMVDAHERKTHYAYVQRPTYDRAFISHYVLKSTEEYGWKMTRGSAMNRHKSWSYFNSTNAQMNRQCMWGRALSKCAQYLATVPNSSTNCFCRTSYTTYRTCVPAQDVVTGFCIVNGTSQAFSQSLESIPVPRCVLPAVPEGESEEELDLDMEEEAIKQAAEKAHEVEDEEEEEDEGDEDSEEPEKGASGDKTVVESAVNQTSQAFEGEGAKAGGVQSDGAVAGRDDAVADNGRGGEGGVGRKEEAGRQERESTGDVASTAEAGDDKKEEAGQQGTESGEKDSSTGEEDGMKQ